MESSEEDDDFPSIESVTPQSKIDTFYQSKFEKVKKFKFISFIGSQFLLNAAKCTSP